MLYRFCFLVCPHQSVFSSKKDDFLGHFFQLLDLIGKLEKGWRLLAVVVYSRSVFLKFWFTTLCALLPYYWEPLETAPGL